jgi:hypothetical protein
MFNFSIYKPKKAYRTRRDTAKVSNEWSCTSTPHINGMNWHDFMFTLTQKLKHCNLSVKNNSPQFSSSHKITDHP